MFFHLLIGDFLPFLPGWNRNLHTFEYAIIMARQLRISSVECVMSLIKVASILYVSWWTRTKKMISDVIEATRNKNPQKSPENMCDITRMKDIRKIKIWKEFKMKKKKVRN